MAATCAGPHAQAIHKVLRCGRQQLMRPPYVSLHSVWSQSLDFLRQPIFIISTIPLQHDLITVLIEPVQLKKMLSLVEQLNTTV